MTTRLRRNAVVIDLVSASIAVYCLNYIGETSSDSLVLKPVYFELTGIQKLASCGRFPSDHWAIMAHFDLIDDARAARTYTELLAEATRERTSDVYAVATPPKRGALRRQRAETARISIRERLQLAIYASSRLGRR